MFFQACNPVIESILVLQCNRQSGIRKVNTSAHVLIRLSYEKLKKYISFPSSDSGQVSLCLALTRHFLNT